MRRSCRRPWQSPQTQFIDRAVNVPSMITQRQLPTVQFQKTVEIPQVEFENALTQSTDQVVDFPAVSQKQVLTVKNLHTQVQYLDEVVVTPVVVYP